MRPPPVSDTAREVHDAALIVDLHCDLLLTSYFLRWNWSRQHRYNPIPGSPLMGQCDIPRLQAGNVGCLGLGLVISPLRRRSAPRAVFSDLDRLHRIVAAAPDALSIATTPQGIRAARAQGRIACFAGLEGAHGLAGRLDDLPEMQRRGLTYVGLAHFTRNAACRPMVGWGSNKHAGLTDYGRDLVDACLRHGLVVDVAHVNKAGLLETCARSPVPVICSHTACTAIHRSPRGLDDEQLTAVARTGGVIGVIFATPFIGPGGVDAVVQHMDYIRRTQGIEHVALGTDWEGWVVYPRALDSADKLPALTEGLLGAGWSADEIHAAYGGNFLRVLGHVQAFAGGSAPQSDPNR
jgi:membrane dipeptidase